MPFKFNPFSGNFDQTGSGGGGASYLDGEVEFFSDLPLSAATAPLDSAWLVRKPEGAWFLTKKHAGLYIRTATGGTDRNADYTYAGAGWPDVFSDANFTLYDDGDSTKNAKFQLSSIATGTTRTITVPDKNITLDDATDPRPIAFQLNAQDLTSLAAIYYLNNSPSESWYIEGSNQFRSALGLGTSDSPTFGSIQNTPIGSTTASSVAATTLSASGTVSGTGFSNYLASPPAIGGTSAAAGSFTTLSASTSLTLGTSGILSGGTNIIEQRNTTSAQTFRIYNTVSGAADANFERGFMRWNTNVLQIGTEKGGTGSARALEFSVDGTIALALSAAGNATIPASGALIYSARGNVSFTADGVLRIANAAVNNFDRLAFGGTTNAFPALKRSSTTLQVRLADDSADAPLSSASLTSGDGTRTSLAYLFAADTDTGFYRRGANTLTFVANNANIFEIVSSGVRLEANSSLQWSFNDLSGSSDLSLLRDAADTLAQRRGLNAQAFRLYNTFTSSTNFERLNIRWASNECIIDAEAGSGGGTLRGIKIGSATSSLLGFYGATPVSQRAAIADATDAATTQARLNDLLAAMRSLGLIAT